MQWKVLYMYLFLYLLKRAILINLGLCYESNFFFFFKFQEASQLVTVPEVNI